MNENLLESGNAVRKTPLARAKGMKLIIAVVLMTLLNALSLPAGAKEKPEFSVSGSLVSSYVWRGLYQSGAAIQPGIGIGISGFSFSAWGSTDFTGQGHKEVDFTAVYSIAGFSVSFSDLWWAGESGIKNTNLNGKNRYFNYDNTTTNHILEAGLAYTLPVEKFPLKISWYTMVWGADKKVMEDGKVRQAYSSYFELAYPFTVGSINLTASVGCSPWESQANYLNGKFAVTNVSLRADRGIKITDSFSLPLFVQAIWNPDRQDIHCVFGIAF